jgi:VWFA-related protein
MMSPRISIRREAYLIPLCLCLLALTIRGQQNPKQQDDPDDVVRISTELVQTDVTVLDKEGRFVDGLKPEQFELSVDGKPQTISFFERVVSGTASEEAQLAAARGSRSSPGNNEGVVPLDRGRTVIFFVDDMHMAADSLIRTRRMLSQFIDREMKQNDQVGITSANGQIGFLQQVTDNKSVLRAAIERLKTSQRSQRDTENPPMSESIALAIQVNNDREILDFFMAPLIQMGMPPQSAETMVRNRARQILLHSYNLTRATLATLENLARTAARLPGRKVLFFISDGFLLNLNETDMMDRLRKITNASARGGVVIYALDSRGLSVGSVADASGESVFDPSGRLTRATLNDVSSTQEPLRMLAANTGGRALLNTNSLSAGFSKALKETSVYYLLAWRPLVEGQGDNKFRRIQVKITGRPELNVQVRRGYYDLETKATSKVVKAGSAKGDEKTVTAEIQETLKSPFPLVSLPTQLSVVYVNSPGKGILITASAQMASQFINFNPGEGKQSAAVDIAALILDVQGKSVGSFKDRLQLTAPAQNNGELKQDLIYNFQALLKPGMYQVRIGARDYHSGRTGSAMQWVEVPDLSQGKLAMSSLLISETTKVAQAAQSDPTRLPESVFSVDRRLARSSKLRFMVYIYNAARGAGGNSLPDVALQVQIMRDDQPVLTTTLRKVDAENGQDPARLPYVAEVPLDEFTPGRYSLQVTIIDRLAKTSASQRTDFNVE